MNNSARVRRRLLRIGGSPTLVMALLATLATTAVAQEKIDVNRPAIARAASTKTGPQDLGCSSTTSRSVLVVFANWLEGHEAEFNTWYEAHVRKILATPGFVSAQRYRIVNSPGRPLQRRHLVIYEIDGDPAAALAALGPEVAAGRLTRPDPTLMELPLDSFLFNPIGSRVCADHHSPQ